MAKGHNSEREVYANGLRILEHQSGRVSQGQRFLHFSYSFCPGHYIKRDPDNNGRIDLEVRHNQTFQMSALRRWLGYHNGHVKKAARFPERARHSPLHRGVHVVEGAGMRPWETRSACGHMSRCEEMSSGLTSPIT